jgi:hypothetical protein
MQRIELFTYLSLTKITNEYRERPWISRKKIQKLFENQIFGSKITTEISLKAQRTSGSVSPPHDADKRHFRCLYPDPPAFSTESDSANSDPPLLIGSLISPSDGDWIGRADFESTGYYLVKVWDYDQSSISFANLLSTISQESGRFAFDRFSERFDSFSICLRRPGF